MDAASLAKLAGNTLVAAAVTDAWEAVRHRFAALFGRRQPDLLTEKRLVESRRQLLAVSPAEAEQLKASLASQWSLRLADLMEQDPDAIAELLEVVEEVSALLPAAEVAAVASGDRSAAIGGDVRVTADRGSIAALTMGDVSLGESPVDPTGPGQRRR